mmetsp:Transcript_16755/g.34518  ORF Transcript_16755/g.34518 Transcript_16755/m.34518 type:complete len:210 (+) Transcript_16755:512-1141(+)
MVLEGTENDDDAVDRRTVRPRKRTTASPIFQIIFPSRFPRMCETLVCSRTHLTMAASGPGMHKWLKPSTPSYRPRLSTNTTGMRSAVAMSWGYRSKTGPCGCRQDEDDSSNRITFRAATLPCISAWKACFSSFVGGPETSPQANQGPTVFSPRSPSLTTSWSVSFTETFRRRVKEKIPPEAGFRAASGDDDGVPLVATISELGRFPKQT